MKRVDVTGQRYGRLFVLRMTRYGKRGEYAGCVCRCDCGGERTIRYCCLRDGQTRSCGCIARERIAASNLKHGDCVGGPSTEWITWHAMHQRCSNVNHAAYSSYGGRGIRVCERWSGDDGFENFLADMGRRPAPDLSLDRYPNNDGDYEPGNCRWATKTEQARNRRSPRSAAQATA